MCIVTLTLKIWPWVKVIIHLWVMDSIDQIQHKSSELWPGKNYGYMCSETLTLNIWPWVKVMTNPWIIDNNWQCVLSKSNITVGSYGPDKDYGYVCCVILTLKIWPWVKVMTPLGHRPQLFDFLGEFCASVISCSMFPLVHHWVNSIIDKNIDHITHMISSLAGILPLKQVTNVCESVWSFQVTIQKIQSVSYPQGFIERGPKMTLTFDHMNLNWQDPSCHPEQLVCVRSEIVYSLLDIYCITQPGFTNRRQKMTLIFDPVSQISIGIGFIFS